MKRISCLTAVLVIVAAGHAGAVRAATAVMFEYENEAGDPVYSYTLPPGQAERGYRKVDPVTGQVLEEVAPALPPEELAAKLARERALAACEDELDRIYQLYGTERDIDYALNEALASLETRIGQLQANLRQARREQGRLRNQAAEAERAGREVSQSLTDNLARSQSQIATLEQEIAQREQEMDDARARYARELERFRDGTCPEPGTVADAGSR
ncbi:MAG: hypothetical protein CMQ43_00910 [Gammaproteobacteria bacterium]|jgi:septal ring factor EnvC (AmiA/AmiB activator)|nr:hypothetical protein [Gammaproteobacteria bacterium]MBK79466.1 hypothetical protein [Gammaproteobacteria bacterium]|tara:strand:- start:3896 stop:4537 length:642 start_codon:yes stop_codon:yes gene_type:complete